VIYTDGKEALATGLEIASTRSALSMWAASAKDSSGFWTSIECCLLRDRVDKHKPSTCTTGRQIYTSTAKLVSGPGACMTTGHAVLVRQFAAGRTGVAIRNQTGRIPGSGAAAG
jgi:hypothetical protein